MPSTSQTHRQQFRDATYEQQIRSITRTMEPRIRAAFLYGMRDIKDRAQMGLLRDALRSGNIADAISAMNIEPAALADMQALIVETYGKTGAETISSGTWAYPDGTKAVVRWNAANPRAEAYARDTVGGMIQNITDDTIQAARDTIADGYAFGRSTDRIARDLVGRIGPNGRRQGGIVGLDQQSAKWVISLRQKLETDPASALSMKLNQRDKDMIRRLVASGKMPSKSQIDNIMRRYENNLLMVRGRRIARTETVNAIEGGKYEAWKQAVDKTGIPEQFIIKEWVHTGRGLIDRPDHVAFSGSTVTGLNGVFTLPSGASMLHSHDASLGAGPGDIINCECLTRYKVDRAGLKKWLS